MISLSAGTLASWHGIAVRLETGGAFDAFGFRVVIAVAANVEEVGEQVADHGIS